MHVAQIDASRWAISARGFNGRFANKLLVLMDGRTLFTPSFSGTYWDMQDTRMEDIERIEVMRGPAGTLWGANAVNGIINIITKGAAQTHGLTVANTAGDEHYVLDARLGSATHADRTWRAFAKHRSHEAGVLTSGAPAHDSAEQSRVGGRSDLQISNADALSLSAEGYTGRAGQTLTGAIMNPVPLFPGKRGAADDERFDGAWLNGQWTHTTPAQTLVELQSYLDHFDRSGFVSAERRDTFDAQLQVTLAPRRQHTLAWGLGARWSADRFVSEIGGNFTPAEADFWLFSAYLQDELMLLADRLSITAGARFEDSQYGSNAFLPSLRALFSVTPRTSLWGAIAKGARRPGRSEADLAVQDQFVPPRSMLNPVATPVLLDFYGVDRGQSEELVAYELGWRWTRGAWAVDAAAYWNVYEHLRGVAPMERFCEPSGVSLAQDPTCASSAQHIRAVSRLTSPSEAEVYGGELFLRWTPTRAWRLAAGYSLMRKDMAVDMSIPAIAMYLLGQDPEHQYQLRSTVSLGPVWDWDVLFRHVGRLKGHFVDSYADVNTRLAWRPSSTWELAFIGRNLLQAHHDEAFSEMFDLMPTDVERALSVQLRWSVR